MNPELIANSMRFHGQPLQKIWSGERGDNELTKLGITNPDFSVYMERQKNLTFQDRAKRLKLHQFLARNADKLFTRDLQTTSVNAKSDSKQDVSDKIVPMPPYEYFINTSAEDKFKVCHSTLEAVKPGSIVYGVISKPFPNGMLVKVLCTREPLIRYLADLNLKAQLPNIYTLPTHDEKGTIKPYAANNFVCCEVLDISVDADRMTLGMKGVLTKDLSAPLGLITPDQIPDYYRRISPDTVDNFMGYLHGSKLFNNTNCYESLYEEVGLDINDTFSHMRSLKHRFPTQDYAMELRQTQASKWAFRSVADGIEHFKIGRHVEAFQCLNKALNIDPRNVEGLVARGALYANKGSFLKAVEDFETALKLNSFHTNARKYMGETLVALGRSYEDDNKLDDAVKAYTNCLNIIPNHEQARISLDALMRRPELAAPLIDVNLLSIPVQFTAGSSELKKKKKNKHKSQSSSSSTDGSSDSESDSDSSKSSSSSSGKQLKKHRKQKSLSPLSKRMGDMNAGNVGSSFEFNQPFHMLKNDGTTDFNKMDDLLGADEDYETRVQKLIKEASQHKKMRDGKSSSSSSKKKSKKNKKKAKKEMARLEKLNATKTVGYNLEPAYQKPPPPVIDLSAEKYERSLMELQNFQQHAPPPPMLLNTVPIDLDNDEPPPAPSFNRAIAAAAGVSQRRSPVPPPPPPTKSSKISIKLQNPALQSSSSSGSIRPQMPRAPHMEPQDGHSFKPFEIKAPVVLDKFGCFRLAGPANDNHALGSDRQGRRSSRSRSREKRKIHSRSDNRSRSRSRSRSRGGGRRRRSRSRDRRRSLSRSPRNGSRRHSRSRRSRSRSRRSQSRSRRSHSRTRRSHSRSRRRSRSRDRRRNDRRSRSRSRSRSNSRRTPSPFDPNRRPRSISPVRRRRRPNSPKRNAEPPQKGFGNRVWQRSSTDDDKNKPPGNNSKSVPSTSNASKIKPPAAKSGGGINDVWQHDKFVQEDGISLEEIDKIIIQAKKERKQEILQRDKKILKKNANNFN